MEWITYLLKVSACTGVFYVCYFFFFKRLTFFSYNRYILLAVVLLSFLIPLLELAVHLDRQNGSASKGYYVMILDNQHFDAMPSDFKKTENTFTSHLNRRTIGVYLYWVVTLLLLLLFLFRLTRLFSLTKRPYNRVGNLKLIYKPKGFSNCSFFNYVFLDKQELSAEEISVLLKHESVHAIRLHSIDRMIITICKTLLWFNPVIYFIDKSLEQVHEFEADQLTSSLVGTRDYAHILLKMAAREKSVSLAHSFAKNPLKARIIMLFADPSKHLRKLTYLSLLPVSCLLIWLFGIKFVYAAQPHLQLGNEDISTAIGPDIDRFFGKAPLLSQIRLIGWNSAPNPLVYIDGKKYDAEILSQISPRCVKLAGVNYNNITLTTYHHKIEFATETDIENIYAEVKAEKTGNTYLRYRSKNEKGKVFDCVRMSAGPFAFGLYISPNKKVLIIIDDKKYSEEEAKNLDQSVIKPGSTFKVIRTCADMRTLYPQYAQQYGALIQILKPE